MKLNERCNTIGSLHKLAGKTDDFRSDPLSRLANNNLNRTKDFE